MEHRVLVAVVLFRRQRQPERAIPPAFQCMPSPGHQFLRSPQLSSTQDSLLRPASYLVHCSRRLVTRYFAFIPLSTSFRVASTKSNTIDDPLGNPGFSSCTTAHPAQPLNLPTAILHCNRHDRCCQLNCSIDLCLIAQWFEVKPTFRYSSPVTPGTEFELNCVSSACQRYCGSRSSASCSWRRCAHKRPGNLGEEVVQIQRSFDCPRSPRARLYGNGPRHCKIERLAANTAVWMAFFIHNAGSRCVRGILELSF